MFYIWVAINSNQPLPMTLIFKSHILPTLILIDESSVVTILSIVVVFFSILLILGVRKSMKLKKENDRLDSMNTTIEDDEKKPYKDFTDGHMYGN